MTRHILFIAPSAYTLSGLATWLDYLLPGLETLGWRTTLGLVEGARDHNVANYLAVHPCQSAIAITCKTGTPQGRRWAVQKAIKQLSPDIVVTVNIPDAIAATAELRHQGKTQAKIVMSCHGIQEDLFADMRLFKDSLDAVVCTNKLACSLAETYGGLGSEHISYAPYGSTVNELTDYHSNSLFTIAYSGRLEQSQKRVQDLVKIIDNLKKANLKFRLLIAGDGPEKEKLQKALHLLDEVSFLGQLSQDDLINQVYRQTDILIMPSFWETGPIVIWEAMSWGIAVVSSRYIGSGLESALKHEENCLMFDVGDCEQASQQIIRLYQDQQLWQTIREQGWATINQKYSHNASVQQWHDVFEQILMKVSSKLLPVTVDQKTSNNRLDNLLGEANAERIRRGLKRQRPRCDAGGEWPHSWSNQQTSQRENDFWRLAQQLDQGE